MSVRVPPALMAGSVVRVIAPSGPFEAPLLWRALGWLSERYRVRYDRGIFARSGYLAGSDERRAAELTAALSEPDVAAVVCARGGYGASRHVHAIDWSALRDHPRWICGFSDVTALHVEAAAAGVASLHVCNATALGRSDHHTRARFVALLESPEQRCSFEGLTRIAPGSAAGPLFGGNLALLHACAAAGRLRMPPGAVLLLEDVGEQPYRLDRMLTTLIVGGHLAGVAAVAVGELTRCSPAADGRTADDVVAESLASLGVPVVAGLPVGHGEHNEPVVLGAPAQVDADMGTLRIF